MTTIKNEEPEGVFSEEGGRLIDAFVTGFRSVKTRSNCRANLRDWMRWTARIGVDAGQAERLHVEAYIRHLEERGYAPNTICQRVATLSSFYRWSKGSAPPTPSTGHGGHASHRVRRQRAIATRASSRLAGRRRTPRR